MPEDEDAQPVTSSDEKEVNKEDQGPSADTERKEEGEGEDDKQVTFSSSVKHPVEDIPMPDPKEAEPTEKEQEEVTYRERLGGYLHPRDMRRLVTPFSASNEPDVIVRRHVILLNFDPLRAIIVRDRLLVIVPDGADSLLVSLEQRVRGGVSEVENSIFGAPSDRGSGDENPNDSTHAMHGSERDHAQPKKSLVDRLMMRGSDLVDEMASSLHSRKDDKDRKSSFIPSIIKKSIMSSSHTRKDSELSDGSPKDDGEMDEWDEMQGREWVNLPFELQCVDACLHIVCNLLSQDTSEIQEATLLYIQGIVCGGGSFSDDPLLVIR